MSEGQSADRKTLNAVYSSRGMKRRYEVWFLRCGLADGSGAWWFRYLVMNLGRDAGSQEATVMPAQVWATWFPRQGEPLSFIQRFPLGQLELSEKGKLPFRCRIARSGIEEGSCWGNLELEGHVISWRLQFASNFGITLSDKGWIGFSRSPHSDAVFSGEIVFDGRRFAGELLGQGVQGHNCGYRHRTYWRWMHAYFPGTDGGASTVEALVYDMPFGMVFRKAVLWHKGKAVIFRKVTEKEIVKEARRLSWVFSGVSGNGLRIEVFADAVAPGIHRLPYTKTDLSGTFLVANASLARAQMKIAGGEILETDTGAVLEMAGG